METVRDRPAPGETVLISIEGVRKIIEDELAVILEQVSSFPHEYEVDRIVARIVGCAIEHH